MAALSHSSSILPSLSFSTLKGADASAAWQALSVIRAALLVITVLIFAAATQQARTSQSCDLLAAPWGDDAASGTAGAPLRSPQALADQLDRGETGCLRGGSYRFTQLKLRTPKIALRSYPGEVAKLRGQIRFEITARGATVRGFYLDGRNSEDLIGPLIYADRARLIGNEITNHHTMICVIVARYYDQPRPRGVVIARNVIHDCGQLPSTNQDHGIYLSSGRGTVIRDNAIYGNVDRGVQMYPDARGTKVFGNLITGNGEGVIFGGDESSASSHNSVRGNVITDSKIRHNIESSWPGPIGSDNSVIRNCVYSPDDGYYGGSPLHSGIKTGHEGFRVRRNHVERLTVRKRRGVPQIISGSPRCRKLVDRLPSSSAGWRFRRAR